MVALLPSRRDGTTHIMHGILLQDWITLRGSTADAVTQGEDGYLDMTPYQDVVTWLDVREVTPPAAGSLFMQFGTSPTKDDLSFALMLAEFSPAVGAAGAPRVDKLLLASAATPVARWMRWKLRPTTAAAWSITFRLWIAANSPGR